VARRSLLIRTSGGLAATLLAGSLAVAAAPAGAARPSTIARFAAPSAIASVGPWIVAANRASSTLTVLAADGGAFIRGVSHTLLGVSAPSAIVTVTAGGRRLVFVGGDAGKVSELVLATQGAWVAVQRVDVLRPAGCGALASALLASDGHGHVVEACSTGALSVWTAATGRLDRLIPSSMTGLTDAAGLAVLGAIAYATNDAAGTAPDGVTAISLASGRRLFAVTNATSATYAFSTPAGISSDGAHLWVANEKGNTVDELARGSLALLGSSSTNLTAPAAVLATPKFTWVSSASVNGSSSMVTQFSNVANSIASPWMMCNSNGPYQFDDPSGFTMHGGMLWVANASDNLIDQMNGATGALVGTYT
jgi:hypothetical protein